MPVISSTSTLPGAARFNFEQGVYGAYEDVGGKLAFLISGLNALVSNMTIVQSALVSANVSAVTFSSLSGVTFTTYPAAISNFSGT